MAKNQRTQNSHVVKGSETKKTVDDQVDKAAEARCEGQVADQSKNPSENQAEKRDIRKAVSLRKELQDLERGLAVMERLLDIAQLSLETPEEIALVAEALAVLGFILNRMVMVRRMVEGDLNPLDIWTTWNDAEKHWTRPDNTDVVFEEWTVTQRVIYARFQLDRAERMVAEALERAKKEAEKGDDEELDS